MIKRAIFIDGSNLFYGLRDHQIKCDYSKLKDFLSQGADTCIVNYYGSKPINVKAKQLNFLFYLQKLGFNMRISKVMERRNRKVEKGLDSNIVDDLNTLLQDHLNNKDHVDIITVVAGDYDYYATLQKIKQHGISIEVASFEDRVNVDLRLLSNKFISLDEHQGKFAIPLSVTQTKLAAPPSP